MARQAILVKEIADDQLRHAVEQAYKRAIDAIGDRIGPNGLLIYASDRDARRYEPRRPLLQIGARPVLEKGLNLAHLSFLT